MENRSKNNRLSILEDKMSSICKGIEELAEIRENLLIIQKRVDERLKQSMDGYLSVYKKNNTHVYIHVQGKHKKYLNRLQSETIKQLEEKYYLTKLSDVVQKEKIKLEKALEILKKTEDIDSVFLRIPEEKRHLIEPYAFVKNPQIIKRFNYTRNEGRVENSTYVSLNGEKVRSKSELIIADRLKSAGVMYVYEPPTALDEDGLEIWHPDFLCLNSRTGRTMYWEHFGMLDNSDYRKSFSYKIERYAKAGILIGVNLIMTTECSEHQLNTEHIDILIKKFLL